MYSTANTFSFQRYKKFTLSKLIISFPYEMTFSCLKSLISLPYQDVEPGDTSMYVPAFSIVHKVLVNILHGFYF